MSLQRYNTVYNAVKDYSCDYQKLSNKVFNNADPSVDYFTGTTGDVVKVVTTNSTGLEQVNGFSREYVIDDFIGFFDFSSGDRQSFMNTDLLGDLTINITWAPNQVLWTPATSTARRKQNQMFSPELRNLTRWISKSSLLAASAHSDVANQRLTKLSNQTITAKAEPNFNQESVWKYESKSAEIAPCLFLLV